MNTLRFLYVLMLVTTMACGQPKVVPQKLSWAERMALSEMHRTPDASKLDFVPKPKWNYTNGLVCSAVERVWNKTGDAKYFNYIKAYADLMIQQDGTIKTYKKEEYNIDKVNSGKFLFSLYQSTRDEKYRLAIDVLRDQMRTHPRTSEGGFWHKQIYPHQMWLDGLYMGSPFLAHYAKVFNEPVLFDDVALQIALIDKRTYDPSLGLYLHGWDESREQPWADKETGRSPHVWGRAMGWFAMALVDVLDHFPEDHAGRDDIIKVLDRMTGAILSSQDSKSGVWYQVMDQPGREGNYLEASASVMFTYYLLKGIRMGYIPAAHREKAMKAYDGVIKNFIRTEKNGIVNITQVCSVAGLGGTPYRDGTFEYYINEPKRDNDPKAVGPFIMMALEYDNLIKPSTPDGKLK
jgi:unsaturated rhamnogalacturonyl hydrolase